MSLDFTATVWCWAVLRAFPLLVQYCAVTLEYHLCKFTSFSMYKYVSVFLYLYISYACACVFVCMRYRSGENNCVHGDNRTYSVYIHRYVHFCNCKQVYIQIWFVSQLLVLVKLIDIGIMMLYWWSWDSLISLTWKDFKWTGRRRSPVLWHHNALWFNQQYKKNKKKVKEEER